MSTRQTQSYILSDAELSIIVEIFNSLITKKKIFTFTGTLGAGKTTLIQSLCRSLGVTEPIQSPTYTYMNSYVKPSITIHHFDLYRLSSYNEFVEAGFEEYLNEPKSVCFIEWPEIITSHLNPALVCSISIDYHEKKRCYTLSYE